MKMGGYFR